MVKLSKKMGSPPAGLQVEPAYSQSPAGSGDPPMEFIKGDVASFGALRVNTSGGQGPRGSGAAICLAIRIPEVLLESGS